MGEQSLVSGVECCAVDNAGVHSAARKALQTAREALRASSRAESQSWRGGEFCKREACDAGLNVMQVSKRRGIRTAASCRTAGIKAA